MVQPDAADSGQRRESEIAARVRELISDRYGATPLDVRRLPNGFCNVTFEVELADRSLIVRTNVSPKVLRGTERNLAILAELGLPVPRVEAADLSMSRCPFSYVVLGKIPGRDLRDELDAMTQPEMTALAERVVSFERLAGTLPEGRGFGWLPIGEAGGFSSWAGVVEDKLARHLDSLGDWVDSSLAVRFVARIAALRGYFDAVRPTSFLDDLTTKNVLVENGHLRGIVDFDVIGYGDPLLWLGLTQTAVVAGHRLNAGFYVHELCRLWPLRSEQRPILAFYSALFALDFACERLPAEGRSSVESLIGLAGRFLAESGG
jgi:aminoglycoside phosphotransferase (APT) family kinase protein